MSVPRVVTEIVEQVADEVDSEPSELPPLWYSVDSEALVNLVASIDTGSIHIEFEYQSVGVIVKREDSTEAVEVSVCQPNE